MTRMIATTPEQLTDLAADMIVIDHVDLDTDSAVLTDERVLIIPTVFVEPDAVLEWIDPRQSDNTYVHGIWVHNSRKASLQIEGVRDYSLTSTLDASDRGLLDIICIDNVITIEGNFGNQLVRASVDDIRVALEVHSDVVDLLTIYQEPRSGIKMIYHGRDDLRRVCSEVGIVPPELEAS